MNKEIRKNEMKKATANAHDDLQRLTRNNRQNACSAEQVLTLPPQSVDKTILGRKKSICILSCLKKIYMLF